MYNKYIDHTLLKSNCTMEEMENHIVTGVVKNVKSICVNPTFVSLVRESLKETDILTCCVVGFPLGGNTNKIKLFETMSAIEDGAQEIDMVINISALKSGSDSYVKGEISSIFEVCKKQNVTLKVIIETCFLTKEEIIRAVQIVNEVKPQFIKTSTGYGTYGATEEDVKLIKEHLHNSVEIKASGGIKTLEDVKKYINLGATRIGTSSYGEMKDEKGE